GLIAAGIRTNRAQIFFRKEAALNASSHARGRAHDGSRELVRTRIRFLDYPKSDTLGAAGADSRHPPQLTDQFLNQRWILDTLHSFAAHFSLGKLRLRKEIGMGGRSAFRVRGHQRWHYVSEAIKQVVAMART